MQRMTKQKRLLHEEIHGFDSFFDVEQLHARVEKRNKNMGLATIYRFLNQLESDVGIHSFDCGGKKIYSINKTNHVHFRCERCDTLRHVNIRNVDFLKELVEDDVCHFQIELTGTCAQCKKKGSSHPHLPVWTTKKIKL